MAEKKGPAVVGIVPAKWGPGHPGYDAVQAWREKHPGRPKKKAK